MPAVESSARPADSDELVLVPLALVPELIVSGLRKPVSPLVGTHLGHKRGEDLGRLSELVDLSLNLRARRVIASELVADSSTRQQQGTQFASHQLAKLCVVRREYDLAAGRDGSKQVQQAEDIEVVHVLNRIVKERKPRISGGEVDREEDADRDRVQLCTTEDRAHVRSRVVSHSFEVDLTALAELTELNVELIENGMW